MSDNKVNSTGPQWLDEVTDLNNKFKSVNTAGSASSQYTKAGLNLSSKPVFDGTGGFTDEYNQFIKSNAPSAISPAPTGYNYGVENSSGLLNFDNRLNGQLYKADPTNINSDTMVSNNLFDTKAVLSDYVSAGDYDGAVKFGYEGTDADFAKLQDTASADTGTDWGMKGYGGLAVGIGQLGLGALSYLDIQETNKIKRDLLRQQYGMNATDIANKASDRTEARSAWGLK